MPPREGFWLDTIRRRLGLPPRPDRLHRAAAAGKLELVRRLLAEGDDPNARDKDTTTPLHRAETAEVARLLLDAGADVQMTDDNGNTAVHWATWGARESAAILDVLLSRGGQVDPRNVRGWTPLMDAASWDDPRALEYLLKHGADVHARNGHRATALHEAAEGGHVECARLLLAHGADVNACNDLGETPLHKAAETDEYGDKHRQVAELLLAAGADVNARANNGETPLSMAQDDWTGLPQLFRAHGAQED